MGELGWVGLVGGTLVLVCLLDGGSGKISVSNSDGKLNSRLLGH